MTSIKTINLSKPCLKCSGTMYYDPDPLDPAFACINCGYRLPETEQENLEIRRRRGSPGVINYTEAKLILKMAKELNISRISVITGHSRDTIREIINRG